MTVFRDKKGRFVKKEDAYSYQDVSQIGHFGRLKKVEEIVEIDEEFEEYEYFIGFDYQTPTLTSKGQKVLGSHGKHDFKTEFRVSSPVKLSDRELKAVIQSKFSDYGVLKQSESYNIKSESTTPVKERPSLNVKRTEDITR